MQTKEGSACANRSAKSQWKPIPKTDDLFSVLSRTTTTPKAMNAKEWSLCEKISKVAVETKDEDQWSDSRYVQCLFQSRSLRACAYRKQVRSPRSLHDLCWWYWRGMTCLSIWTSVVWVINAAVIKHHPCVSGKLVIPIVLLISKHVCGLILFSKIFVLRIVDEDVLRWASLAGVRWDYLSWIVFFGLSAKRLVNFIQS